MVDEYSQGRGRCNAGEQGPNLGLALHGGVRRPGLSLPLGREKRPRDQENVAQRVGLLVARWLHLRFKVCTHEDEVPQGGQSCFRHGCERQRQQGVECHYAD